MSQEYSIIKTLQYRGCGFMTVCKYNNSGDMIYIGDKDSKKITAIETLDYNIIGTFEGHNGVIWSLDISKDDSILVSASGDLTIGFFSTSDGIKLFQSSERCIPKYVCTQKNNLETNLVAVICEAITKKSSTYISIYDLDLLNNQNPIDNYEPKIKLLWGNLRAKPTVITWFSNEQLIVGCEDGKIILRNINDMDGSEEKEYQIHSNTIKSIVWNKTQKQILTSSLDCEAKHLDPFDEFKLLATYKSSVPINSACWNHNDRKVILGGGIEAMNVAKTSDNDLNIKIYRTSDQKLTNHISSHFGPIRFIDKAPKGKNFMTASQDGSVKIYFIVDENNNKEKVEEEKSEQKIFTKFGNLSSENNYYSIGDDEQPINNNIKLIEETNKIMNLSWKPPKVKEEKVQKYIPGMPVDKKTNSDNFGINDLNSNSSLEIDKKLSELKKQEEVENSTIRITNLPLEIRNKDLGDIFDLYGRIEDRGIRIKDYSDTTMAFIKYAYPESAQKAIENADGMVIDYCIIKVEMAKPK